MEVKKTVCSEEQGTRDLSPQALLSPWEIEEPTATAGPMASPEGQGWDSSPGALSYPPSPCPVKVKRTEAPGTGRPGFPPKIPTPVPRTWVRSQAMELRLPMELRLLIH